MSPPPISCEASAPPLPSNNDITGIGVIINYVATAGLAILLIMVYYLMIHEPVNDPFRVNGQAVGELSRPNPVDRVLLQSLRGALKHIPLIKSIRFRTNRKIELFFLKSIVAMSDLQVVTGLAILISGFVQLRSGLATYYWMVLVHLAWFSCITHLSCLTLLRNHLYNNGIERGWRLVAMATLAILELIGLGPTGNYDWAFCSDCDYHQLSYGTADLVPAPNDYALCFMNVTPEGWAFPSMALSMALIVFGFGTRVAKLYRSLSVGIFGRLRAFLSRRCRRLLRRVYLYSFSVCSKKRTLRWKLLYVPLLSTFLMGRLLLDQWCSLYLEVFWLIVSFTWGITNMIHIVRQPEVLHFHVPNDNYDWSFGQVVSVLLLIAPVISLLENFSEIKGAESDMEIISGEIISGQVHDSHSPQNFQEILPHSFINQDPMDPDNDWDLHLPTFKAALTYFNLVFMIIYARVMIFTTDSLTLTLFGEWIEFGTFLAPLLGLFGVILFSLSIEPLLSQGRTALSAFLILFILLWFTTCIAFPAIENIFAFIYTGPMEVFPFFGYFTYVIIRHFLDLVAGNGEDSGPASQV